MITDETAYVYRNYSSCIVDLILPTDVAQLFMQRFTWIGDSKLSKNQNENCFAFYSNSKHAHGSLLEKQKALEHSTSISAIIKIILSYSEEYITSLYYEFPIEKISFLRISKNAKAADKQNLNLYFLKHGGVAWYVRLVLRQIVRDLHIPPSCIQDPKLFEMNINIATKSGILVSYNKYICFKAMALNYKDLLAFYEKGGHRAEFSRNTGILEELRSKTTLWTNFTNKVLNKNERLLKALPEHTLLSEVSQIQIIDLENEREYLNGKHGEVIEHYDFENEQFTVRVLDSNDNFVVKIAPENVKPVFKEDSQLEVQ